MQSAEYYLDLVKAILTYNGNEQDIQVGFQYHICSIKLINLVDIDVRKFNG